MKSKNELALEFINKHDLQDDLNRFMDYGYKTESQELYQNLFDCLQVLWMTASTEELENYYINLSDSFLSCLKGE